MLFNLRYKQGRMKDYNHLLINKIFDGFTGKLRYSKWAKFAKCSADTALHDINDLIKKKSSERARRRKKYKLNFKVISMAKV